jgi:tetratricopeptide (TPR) repeat protein
VKNRLQHAEDLLNQAKLNEALEFIKTLEKEKEISVGDRLKGQILKSQILKSKGEYEKSLKLSEEALIESKKQNKSLLELDAHIIKAGIFEKLERYDESLKEITLGEELVSMLSEAPERDIKCRKADLLQLRGRNLGLNQDPLGALESLKQSLVLYEEYSNKSDKALSLCDIGKAHYTLGEMSRAMDYFQQSLVLNAEIGNKLGMAVCLSNIGNFHRGEWDFDQAEDYFLRSLRIVKELGNKSEQARSFIYLGVLYLRNDPDKAQETFHKALTIYHEIGNQERLARALLDIGFQYSLSGVFERGLEYLHKGKEIFEKIGHKWGVAHTSHTLGWTYQSKGELKQALKYCNQSLIEYQKIDESRTYPFSIWPQLNLGIIYYALGDSKAAYEHLTKCVTLSEEYGTVFAEVYALYYLISLSLDESNIEEGKTFLQQLKNLSTQTTSSDEKKKVTWKPLDVLQQFSQISEGLILKASPRLKDKVRAQEIFQQLLEKHTVVNIDITYFAMLHLCELQLFELRVSQEKDVLHGTKRLIQQLTSQVQNLSSYTYWIHALILQAKLAMVEGDLISAAKFLDQARITAEEKGLAQLMEKVSTEISQLEHQYESWKQLIQSNAPIQERLDHAHLKDYLKDALRLARLGTMRDTK